MNITIKYFGMLAEIAKRSEETITFTEKTVSDLLEVLYEKYPELKEKAESGILWIRISVAKTMPPRPLNPLTDEELEIIKCWLDDGAQNN